MHIYRESPWLVLAKAPQRKKTRQRGARRHFAERSTESLCCIFCLWKPFRITAFVVEGAVRTVPEFTGLRASRLKLERSKPPSPKPQIVIQIQFTGSRPLTLLNTTHKDGQHFHPPTQAPSAPVPQSSTNACLILPPTLSHTSGAINTQTPPMPRQRIGNSTTSSMRVVSPTTLQAHRSNYQQLKQHQCLNQYGGRTDTTMTNILDQHSHIFATPASV